jgi:hypothetical protein
MITKRAQIQALREDIEQVKQLAKTQALIIDDISTVQTADATAYRGNQYRNYKSAVLELARKYEGTAKWGVIQTGNILDVRSAFIIGEGINIYSPDEDKAEPELEFVKRFMEFNDLDREMAQEFAKEAEIEGRFLGQLFWDAEAKMVSLRFRSWATTKYDIKTDPNDYSKFISINWTKPGGEKVTLEEPDFIYSRFAGRIHQPDMPYPKVAKCLGQLEALDKALKDWSEITRLYAAPVPHIECETAEQAKYMKDAIAEVANNYKLKKLFAHTGKFSYAGPDTAGMQYLEKLIITLAKMISGTTGVPVGLMGFGDLTTKLGASSDIIADQLSATTSKERQIWTGTYEQILTKAMAMWNGNSGKKPLDSNLVKVNIPFVTNETWKRIADVWLPLHLSGSLSLKTLLSKIPDINVGQEADSIENEADERAKKDFNIIGDIDNA